MKIKQNEHCYINYGKDDINEQHRKINGELREEIKRLENNWNKLKEYINLSYYDSYMYSSTIINKMQEIESGGSDE